jgi:hypothetical protein
MEIRPSPRNLFLVGKIRALEKELFDSSRFYRLLENKTETSFINDLSDSRYQKYVAENGFERGLKKYSHYIYVFFRENIDVPAVLDIFMIKRDISNFINYIKGIKAESVYNAGVFSEDWWKKDKMPPFFRRVREKLVKIMEGGDISRTEDRLIEKICLDCLSEEYFRDIKSAMILDYWKYTIDTGNLLRNLNHPQPAYYWSGGNIDERFWENVDVREDIPKKLEVQPYIRDVAVESGYTAWEIRLRKWLSRFLKQMRKISFGNEPILSYFLCLLEEMTNLRLIYTGIRMEMDPRVTRESLNLAYV